MTKSVLFLRIAAVLTFSAEAILFWQLASLAKTDARRLRPILATFLVAYSVMTVNSYTYFFLGPVIAEIFIAACLGLAMVTAECPAAAYAGAPQRA